MSSEENDERNNRVVPIVVNRRPLLLRYHRNSFTSLDEIEFRIKFRMSKRSAWMILELLRDKIRVPNLGFRAGTDPPEQMFLLTLRFFAKKKFPRDNSTSSNKILLVVRYVGALIGLLSDRFIKFPTQTENQIAIQKRFYKKSKFPHVIAAMDCTHIKIIRPDMANVESFRTGDGFYSKKIQILCDSDLNIMNINASGRGSTQNAQIFNTSEINRRFENNEFGDAIVVANSAYACKNWLKTPLTKVNTAYEDFYNAAHMKAWNCIKDSIELWKRRFPILSTDTGIDRGEVVCFTFATAVLHNVCILNNEKSAPPFLNDQVS